MTRMRSIAVALLALSAGVFGSGWPVPTAHAAPAPAEEPGPEKPVRVLLFGGGPTREFRFLCRLFADEAEHKRAELSVCLQQQFPAPQTMPGVPPERILEAFPSIFEPDETKEKPGTKYANLFRYDVVIAVDPDWQRLAPEQLALLEKWVATHGRGLIVVGGLVNTLQLARPGASREKLRPVVDLLPVVLKDVRLIADDRRTDKPRRLHFRNPPPEMTFLNLDGQGKKSPASGWESFFTDGQPGQDVTARGPYGFYPIDRVKEGAAVVATFGDAPARGNEAEYPYLVAAAHGKGRVIYLGSGEMWRLRQFREDFYARFWTELARYDASQKPWSGKLFEPPPARTAEQRQAVAKGLDWLAQAQKRDGRWEGKGGEHPVALTGLAAIALLMEGSTLTEGRHADAVRRATDYLITRRQRSGLIGNPNGRGERDQYLYGHAFATLFLAHVYGEEEDLDRRRTLEALLTRAVEYSRQARSTRGGWAAVAAEPDGDLPAEVFSTLVHLHALHAVRGAGIHVPAAVLDTARAYLEKEAGPPATAAAAVMTSGRGPFDSALAQKWVKAAGARAVPEVGKSLRDDYLHFGHAQLAYFLGDVGYGKLFPESRPEDRLTWGGYRKAAVAALLKAQNADGSWGDEGTRVYATALALMILQLEEAALPGPQR
jgi:hypothetical protein